MSQVIAPQSYNTPRSLQFANVALMSTVWISSTLFGLYILAFYIVAAIEGDLSVWNEAALPDLYEEGESAATVGIGIHFGMGAVILILGGVQFLQSIRRQFPEVHRWLGRIYIIASLLTAIGGLAFIAVSGTVGGPVMNTSFGVYGILMLICSIETIRHARIGRFEQHRAWSWRLYALAIGSWLYRMEYGFWFLIFEFTATTPDFRGGFDYIMMFLFYVPNLVVVEMLLRSRNHESTRRMQVATTAILLFATALVILATYSFTTLLWGPIILSALDIG